MQPSGAIRNRGSNGSPICEDMAIGGCLADDMGLGKTIQTIALLASIYPEEKKPSLIVMPKTLLFNWESELKKFAPNLTFCQYLRTERDIETMGLQHRPDSNHLCHDPKRH